MVEQSYKRS